MASNNNNVKPQPVAVETPKQNEEGYEETNVHKVYQEIASHFSETRYKVRRLFLLQTRLILVFDLREGIKEKEKEKGNYKALIITIAMASGRNILT